MTPQERASEVDRLMAILEGTAEPAMLTETGDLQMESPAGLPPHCTYCAMLESPEDLRVFQGEEYCETCWIAVQWLHRWQVVCLRCDGKRLLYGPTQPDGGGVRWHDCELCLGRGWLHGDVVFDSDSEEGQEVIRRVEADELIYQEDPVTGQGWIRVVRPQS